MNRDAQNDRFPLFSRYPRLAETLPWMSIGDWPTPVAAAPTFAEREGLASFYVKREDLSHAEFGGNKVRGLEFLLGDAKRRGVKALLTLSAAGSHHVSRTAAHARRVGIETTAVVLHQPSAAYVRGNLFAGITAGARYIPANYLTLPPRLLWHYVTMRLKYGRGGAMYIPPGGSSPLACVGHVNAALELSEQVAAGLLPMPDYLYVAMGSLGTAAGLVLGCKLAGMKTRVVGVVTSMRWYCTPGRVAKLARATAALLRRHDPAFPDVQIESEDLMVVNSVLGRGYGHVTDSAAQWGERFEACEGIRLDSTYTAKALDGAMQFIHENRGEKKNHLFWHTYQELPMIEMDVARVPFHLRRYMNIK